MKKGELPYVIFIAAILFTVAGIASLIVIHALPIIGRSTTSVITAVGSDVGDAESYSFQMNAISFLRSEEDGLNVYAHFSAYAACVRSGSDCSAMSDKLDSYADKYLAIYEEPRRCIVVELRDPSNALLWAGRQSRACIFAQSSFSGALHKDELLIPTGDSSAPIVFVQKRALS